MGFVSKERIEQLLKEKEAGTFLLHFSEDSEDGAITFCYVDFDSNGELRVFPGKSYTEKELSVTSLPAVIEDYLVCCGQGLVEEYKNPLDILYPYIHKNIFSDYKSPETPSEEGRPHRDDYSISRDPVAPQDPDPEVAADAAQFFENMEF